MTRKIDPIDITTRDPAPALIALGWTLSAPKSNRWSFPGRKDLSAFLGRNGDWLIKDFGTGRTGNFIIFVRALEPSLSFPEALIRANELLRATTDTSPSNPSLSKNPLLAVAALGAADIGSSTVIDHLTPDEIRQKYVEGAEIWRPGHLIPPALRNAGITHIGKKFDETFYVSGEGSARIQEIGLRDDGQPALVGYETRRENGRTYKSKGGRNGISITVGLDASTSIVVTDSLPEAMAHDLAWPEDPLRGYIAVSPGAEEVAVRMIRGMIAMGAMFGDVIISTSNNAAGMLCAHKIMSRIDNIKGLEVRYIPPAGKMKTHAEALQAIMRDPGKKPARIREAIEQRIAADGYRHPGEYRPETAYAAE